MARTTNIAKETGLVVASLGVGAFLWFVVQEGYRPNPLGLLAFCYRQVGITIIVLIPLMLWAAKVIITGPRDELALAYIGEQAKDVGFLGTVLGIMVMFAALSISAQQGDSDAIKMAIGGFSQAAISTAVGLVIASVCKHCRFLIIRRQTREDGSHAATR